MLGAIRMAARMRNDTLNTPCVEAYRSWHFFMSKKCPGVWCAVAFKAKIPKFLLKRHWQYCKSESCAGLNLRFNSANALQGVEINGFYLFYDLQANSRTLLAA